MIPPKQKMEFEKITTNDFVTGTIEDIIYDMEHEFKGFQGQPPKVKPGVRLVFSVDGYKHPHKTPFMAFNYNAKANLFKKYICSLVENPVEYMLFDLDQIKGMKVKMLWADNPGSDYQHIETIRPFDKKIARLNAEPAPVFEATHEESVDEETPF